MEFGGINYLAIPIAAIASFAAGSVWYGILGEKWRIAAGLDEETTRPKPLVLINALVCQIIMTWVLAGLIGHLGEGQVTLRNGIISALFVWFGFVLTTQLVNHRFQAKSWTLSWIDCGHWLIVLVIQGAAIGLIGTSSS